MSRADRRADERQRESVRSELHGAVDSAVDSWPVLERQARDMGRGFPSQGDGPGGVGGHGDPVPRLALEDRVDPAVLAEAWLREFESWRRLGSVLASRARGLLPADVGSVERGRVNSVEVCAECGDPIGDRVKRIDGNPYHASSCYFRVWRSGRAS